MRYVALDDSHFLQIIPVPVMQALTPINSAILALPLFEVACHVLTLRLLEPGSDNLHSWALRKLPKRGEKVLAVQQPTHSADYIGFKGVIPKGYGAGAVNIFSKGKAKVMNASPTKITFTVGKELFTLIKPDKMTRDRDWLLLNRTPIQKQAGAVGAGPNDIVALLMTGMLKGTPLAKMLERFRKAGV